MERITNETLLLILRFAPMSQMASIQAVSRRFYVIIVKNWVELAEKMDHVSFTIYKGAEDYLAKIRLYTFKWKRPLVFVIREDYIELLDTKADSQLSKNMANLLALIAGSQVSEVEGSDGIIRPVVKAADYLEVVFDLFNFLAIKSKFDLMCLYTYGLPDGLCTNMLKAIQGTKPFHVTVEGPMSKEDILLICNNIDSEAGMLDLSKGHSRVVSRAGFEKHIMDDLLPFADRFQLHLGGPYIVKWTTLLQLFQDWQSGRLETLDMLLNVEKHTNYLDELQEKFSMDIIEDSDDDTTDYIIRRDCDEKYLEIFISDSYRYYSFNISTDE